MDFRRAKKEELAELWRFYGEVCAAQSQSPFSPSWHIGIYPAKTDLQMHIQSGEMQLCRSGDDILAAASLTGRDDPLYADAIWRSDANGEDVAVIHLFAVHPSYRRKGISDRMLTYLISLARQAGKRVLRLDVVTGNLPAERLYQKHGFLFAEERKVFYEDMGEIRVRLYERILQE